MRASREGRGTQEQCSGAGFKVPGRLTRDERWQTIQASSGRNASSICEPAQLTVRSQPGPSYLLRVIRPNPTNRQHHA
jgi:hypothetical protein